MRPFYLFLKIVLSYCLRIQFKKSVSVNAPKKFKERTIFTSNHPSSFMDPFTISVYNNPIVFTMTRGDIYKGFMKFVFWNTHMIPIYRNQDGEDAVRNNKKIFNISFSVLKKGKSIIIFAEGFTDDIFIRRLKPIKKGSIRMGFGALEYCNWEKKIYIQAVGINYTDPKKFRSEVLTSFGNKICLNDYKDSYLENPNKTINELTKYVEKEMRQQITHIENKELCAFHEQIMMLTRKGMNEECKDTSIPLKKRWEFSKKLAHWLNTTELSTEVEQLKSRIENYFSQLKNNNIEENYIALYAKKKTINTLSIYLFLIITFPFAILGLLHGFPSYFIVKPKIESVFKRDVFWSSVKMMAGFAIGGIYNILFIFLFYHFVYANWGFAFLYYFIVPPFTFVLFHKWLSQYHELKTRKRLLENEKQLNSFVEERYVLINEINKCIPL
jgi:1-acyl-sn-glycerol-3-phosphate acyltransferase